MRPAVSTQFSAFQDVLCAGLVLAFPTSFAAMPDPTIAEQVVRRSCSMPRFECAAPQLRESGMF